MRLAADHGASIVEGYPVEPRKDRVPPVFAYTGLFSAFRDAGFAKCYAIRNPTDHAPPALGGGRTARKMSPPSPSRTSHPSADDRRRSGDGSNSHCASGTYEGPSTSRSGFVEWTALASHPPAAGEEEHCRAESRAYRWIRDRRPPASPRAGAGSAPEGSISPPGLNSLSRLGLNRLGSTAPRSGAEGRSASGSSFIGPSTPAP